MALKDIGAAWKSKPESKAFYGGRLKLDQIQALGIEGNEVKFFIFPNRERKNDRQPDIRIMAAVDDEERQPEDERYPSERRVDGAGRSRGEDESDDLPF